MAYQSFNPTTLSLMKEYDYLSDNQLNKKINLSESAFSLWSNLSFEKRIDFIVQIARLTEQNKKDFASLITAEMGKPITQSMAEIDKCVLLCQYYLENAERIISPQHFYLKETNSRVVYEPLGAVYGIMPWNFPFWQVFRYVIPNLILGNTIFLKHASNVPQCAESIEKLILQAGIPEGVFQNLFIDYHQSEKVIASSITSGVTLTGSEPAGAFVASIAGKYLKKTVLELGGSDPFLVFSDADLDSCIKTAIFARFQNAGQSCIAAKRFIINENIYQEFLERLTAEIRKIKIGDPLKEETELGPMARDYLLKDIEIQVKKSIETGARLIAGGKRLDEKSLFYEPTILDEIKENMPVFSEEVFGPVISLFKFSHDEEAINLANRTPFGLGASLWTKDIDRGLHVASAIRAGTIALNGLVKSHPALPFGGVKKSGYGRELGEWGMKEFANVKTINIFN